MTRWPAGRLLPQGRTAPASKKLKEQNLIHAKLAPDRSWRHGRRSPCHWILSFDPSVLTASGGFGRNLMEPGAEPSPAWETREPCCSQFVVVLVDWSRAEHWRGDRAEIECGGPVFEAAASSVRPRWRTLAQRMSSGWVGLFGDSNGKGPRKICWALLGAGVPAQLFGPTTRSCTISIPRTTRFIELSHARPLLLPHFRSTSL